MVLLLPPSPESLAAFRFVCTNSHAGPEQAENSRAQFPYLLGPGSLVTVAAMLYGGIGDGGERAGLVPIAAAAFPRRTGLTTIIEWRLVPVRLKQVPVKGTVRATAERTRTNSGPVTDAEYRALAQFCKSLRWFSHFSGQAAKAAGLTPSQHQLLLAVRGAAIDQPPTIGSGRLVEAAPPFDRRTGRPGRGTRPSQTDLRSQRPPPPTTCFHPARTISPRCPSTLNREELRRFREKGFSYLQTL